MREFYIIRGIPGCGKSTLANVLAANCNSVICCADDYFRGTNESYNFIPEFLGDAHRSCQEKAKKGIFEEKERIIIDNVNATTAHILPYIQMAEQANYRVISLIVEHRHQEVNQHHVPEHSRRRMAEQMLKHIKLMFSR